LNYEEAMASISENPTIRQFVVLVLLTGLAYLGWGTKLLFPFEVITTFLHEISHAFGFLLTGGSVIELNVHPDTSGSLPGYGGSKFFIFSSGYIGSCIFGAMLYLSAAKTDLDRWILAFFGTGILALTFFLNGNEFAWISGILIMVVSLAIAKFAPKIFCDFLIRFIGLTSMLFPVYDVYQTVVRNPGVRSDAAMLAEAVGGSTVMWGWLWIIVSVIVIGLTVRWSLKTKPT